jgi:hypothetical protein
MDSWRLLSAIVVLSADGQPGKGFFDLARQLDRDSDSLACWVQEVNRVYEEAAQVSA